MADGRTRQLLMAGLPETGKTSFLALFYTALVNGRTERLKLASFQDEREYLNQINGRLLRCEPAVHTEVSEDRDLSLSLTIADTEQSATLRIPDLSGETWGDVVLRRTWTSQIEEQVEDSEAMLVFLHPGTIDPGPTLADVVAATEALTPDGDEDDAEVVGRDATEDPADPGERRSESRDEEQADNAVEGKPPTQVLITDLLQLTLEQRGPRPARASIIVSAWDRAGDGVTPDQFVALNLPLLDQYMAANAGWLQVRNFGVSAQGGDFETKESRKALVEHDAVSRAVIMRGNGESVSVETPVAWALGLEAK